MFGVPGLSGNNLTQLVLFFNFYFEILLYRLSGQDSKVLSGIAGEICRRHWKNKEDCHNRSMEEFEAVDTADPGLFLKKFQFLFAVEVKIMYIKTHADNL